MAWFDGTAAFPGQVTGPQRAFLRAPAFFDRFRREMGQPRYLGLTAVQIVAILNTPPLTAEAGLLVQHEGVTARSAVNPSTKVLIEAAGDFNSRTIWADLTQDVTGAPPSAVAAEITTILTQLGATPGVKRNKRGA